MFRGLRVQVPGWKRFRSAAFRKVLGSCSLGLLAVGTALVCEGQEVTKKQVTNEIRAEDLDLRLSEVQVIGTHNSYHLAPLPEVMRIISLTGKGVADAIDYTHLPLDRQYTEQGIRQIELDLYADPQGGLYSKPIGKQALGAGVRDDRR